MINIQISAIIILSALVLVGCSSNINTYQEPQGRGVATIQVEKNRLAGLLGAVIMMPDNDISLISVDGKELGHAFSHDSTNVTPGRHTLMFACTLDAQILSQALVTINAVPGKTYTVSYPSSMRGYTTDTEAGKKLIIR